MANSLSKWYSINILINIVLLIMQECIDGVHVDLELVEVYSTNKWSQHGKFVEQILFYKHSDKHGIIDNASVKRPGKKEGYNILTSAAKHLWSGAAEHHWSRIKVLANWISFNLIWSSSNLTNFVCKEYKISSISNTFTSKLLQLIQVALCMCKTYTPCKHAQNNVEPPKGSI